jgi:DNA-binding SARP family transcriptional activator/tetratricopeptide (TPR) repeat protein
MVRRLVIPIDIAASVEGAGERDRYVTDVAADQSDPAPGGVDDDTAVELPGVETDAFAASVVHSKVRSPAIRPSTLERPRLLTWLERYAGARLRVISTEAGYGKSTLLADHARRTGRRTIWYRLEPSDRDWVTFLSYIVASVREIVPGFGAGTVGMLQQVGVLNATRDLTLDTLLAELEPVATEPLSLVLDDFHTVQDSEDIRSIVVRLLEHAPSGFSLVIAGRDRPSIPMARLTAQAGVAELTTEDLRFTRSETADLFAHSYGTPIDEDLVTAIDERLEGWGASLQLVCASLLSLRPEEVRAFVRDLSAHSEPLYDFLAEEVLSRQTPVMRRVLTHAALLERISPHLLAAATADPRPVSIRQITVCLYRAEDAGMISRIATGSTRWRFHPLIREFLRARLLSNLSPDQMAAMHLRVATAAEPSDWLAATHHFLEAGRPHDGMRVLRGAAMQALGTASWGRAIDLLDRMPEGPVPIAAMIIRARGLVARGQGRRAVEMLEPLVPDEDDPSGWGLLRAALANAYMVTGQFEKVQSVAEAILRNPDSPKVAVDIARGFTTVIAANAGGSIATACEVLAELGEDLARQELPYFAAVSFHNAALGHFARGRYSAAVGYGRRAISQLELTAGQPGVESTHVLVAMALWELGQHDQADRCITDATAREDSPSDAQADGAWILGATGAVDDAWLLLARAARGAIDGAVEPGAHACVQYSRVLVSLVSGDAQEASAALDGAREGSIELDAIVRHASLAAMVALANDRRDDAVKLADEGLRVAVAQGAGHWEQWLRLVRSVASGNRDEYRRSLLAVLTSATLSTLALAGVVLQGLPLLDAVPPALEESIARWPRRWLPVLRAAVQGPNSAVAQLAAQLLATHGTLADVALLTAYERSHVRPPTRRVLGRQLARHANPTLMLHDLGHIAIDIGHRRLLVSHTRRRTASLLAFLASRPNHAATKELVLESLWPRQSPAGAANSLHQTLFYLRRDIDPWFNEAHSIHYLVVEPDLVFFDRELVQVDSSSFVRQASSALLSDQVQVLGPPLLRDYMGTFAPEFEYEDWSMAWRDRVHATYLQLVQRTSEALIAQGHLQQGIDVVGRALIVDSSALDLEASLIVALLEADATAAAAHQYSHFARACAEELGVTAPSLADLHARRPDAWPSLRNPGP